MMPKHCKCGAEQTDGPPVYCHRCQTFTNIVYFKGEQERKLPHAERVTEADATAEAERRE